jgi:hypothetical protein
MITLPTSSRRLRGSHPQQVAAHQRPSGRSHSTRTDRSTITSPTTTRSRTQISPGIHGDDQHPNYHNHSPPRRLTRDPVQISATPRPSSRSAPGRRKEQRVPGRNREVRRNEKRPPESRFGQLLNGFGAIGAPGARTDGSTESPRPGNPSSCQRPPALTRLLAERAKHPLDPVQPRRDVLKPGIEPLCGEILSRRIIGSALFLRPRHEA